MNNQRPETDHSEVASIWIDAAPGDVWRRVANIANLGRYSPETTRTAWLPGSDRHEMGARFRGYNRNGRHQWHTDCVITEWTEFVAFAFDVAREADGRFATRWRYTLASENGGTRLTESFVSPIRDAAPAEMNPERHSLLVDMLDTTLACIKADIEASDDNRTRPCQ
jgi:hypothetical protein